MMIDDTTLTATAQILSNLAAESASTAPITVPASSKNVQNITLPLPLPLPGRDTPGKRSLETELAKLVARIERLESRANAATTFPETPNETTDSLFGDPTAAAAANGRRVASPSGSSTASSTSKQSRIANARQGISTDPSKHPSSVTPQQDDELTEEALEGLREHVDDQSKLLDSQRQELAGVNAQLLEQKQLQETVLAKLEQERVATLERELWKHQKANEAFQKALREIGEIVTAVARGDLSKKVRMNTVEMDPEITTFKRTINTMMDQLQVFSSEVSRVAREVGTEGLLGGQARIDGVDGTWKELTDNGEPIHDAAWS